MISLAHELFMSEHYPVTLNGTTLTRKVSLHNCFFKCLEKMHFEFVARLSLNTFQPSVYHVV